MTQQTPQVPEDYEAVEPGIASATTPWDAELIVQTQFPEDEFPDPPQDARDLGQDAEDFVVGDD